MNYFSQQPALQPIIINQSLKEIYHGIQQQLCSKQSTLLNKLKNVFSNLYDGLKPSYYVIVNNILQLTNQSYSRQQILNQSDQISQKQSSINLNYSYNIDASIAIENGTYLLFKKTYLKDSIFINGVNLNCQLDNKQLIFQCNGNFQKQKDFKKKKQNNQNTFIRQITQIIELANDSLSLNKLYGAIVYIYGNINQIKDTFRQSILLALYFAVLSVNDNLYSLSKNQIFDKLHNSNIFDQKFLIKQFKPYNKGEILITRTQNHNNQENVSYTSIPFPRKLKLLFFSSQFLINKIKGMNSITYVTQNSQNNSKNGQGQIDMQNQTSNDQNNQNKFFTNLKQELQRIKSSQIGFLSSLIKNKEQKSCNNLINRSKFIEINEILSQNDNFNKNKLYFNSMNFIKNNVIQIPNYIVSGQKSQQIHQKIRKLRKYTQKLRQQQQKQLKLMENQQQKDTQNPQRLQKRFTSKINYDKIIFSAIPSVGLAILNPQNQIWFK